MGRELNASSNLGPGTYDLPGMKPVSRPGSSSSMSHSHVPIEHRLVQRARGPPPGTYDVPRILDPSVVGSELGRQISSPFKNSGRQRQLLAQGSDFHYRTLREECIGCNMGPGAYNIPDPWRPGKLTHKLDTVTSGFQPRASSGDQKPWRDDPYIDNPLTSNFKTLLRPKTAPTIESNGQTPPPILKRANTFKATTATTTNTTITSATPSPLKSSKSFTKGHRVTTTSVIESTTTTATTAVVAHDFTTYIKKKKRREWKTDTVREMEYEVSMVRNLPD